MGTLLLASGSPRRLELLSHLGVQFDVVPSSFDEMSVMQEGSPEDYVVDAALGKARDVARARNGIVIGVDTDVVSPDGLILGKPADVPAAHAMLRSLAGRTHRVLSGVALVEACDGAVVREATRMVETRVTFAPLGDAAISAYVATGEPFDKAGGYGMQGAAMAFVSRIEGDPSNVIGLPLWTLAGMLEDFDVPLWRQGDTRA